MAITKSVPACQAQNDSNDHPEKQAQSQEPSGGWEANQEKDKHSDCEKKASRTLDGDLVDSDPRMDLRRVRPHWPELLSDYTPRRCRMFRDAQGRIVERIGEDFMSLRLATMHENGLDSSRLAGRE
ncbi:MAG: hypothetical protein ABSB82_05340 [Terriglobia bacterium]